MMITQVVIELVKQDLYRLYGYNNLKSPENRSVLKRLLILLLHTAGVCDKIGKRGESNANGNYSLIAKRHGRAY